MKIITERCFTYFDMASSAAQQQLSAAEITVIETKTFVYVYETTQDLLSSVHSSDRMTFGKYKPPYRSPQSRTD